MCERWDLFGEIVWSTRRIFFFLSAAAVDNKCICTFEMVASVQDSPCVLGW